MKKIHYCLLFILITLSACGRYNVPRPKDSYLNSYGAIINIYNRNGKQIGSGELIAAMNNKVYVLHHKVVAYDDSDVITGKLIIARTSDHPEAISTWGALLPLTSFAHGFGMLLSLPVNLAVGVSIAVSASSSAYTIRYPSEISRENLSKFARFPQGIPTNITLNDLDNTDKRR